MPPELVVLHYRMRRVLHVCLLCTFSLPENISDLDPVITKLDMSNAEYLKGVVCIIYACEQSTNELLQSSSLPPLGFRKEIVPSIYTTSVGLRGVCIPDCNSLASRWPYRTESVGSAGSAQLSSCYRLQNLSHLLICMQLCCTVWMSC